MANLLTGNIFDIVFGSLATLAAALLTAALGRRKHTLANSALACLMPVVFNALIVGAVITAAYEGMNLFQHFGVFAMNAAYVGLGEAIVLYVLGLALMRKLSLPVLRRSLSSPLGANPRLRIISTTPLIWRSV